ncbi:hypothetical protein FOCC_FOCC009406 [Frankliniella occidentalis]|nr:hypothetical protein FOCC_FOCC009406 [Frankliniella occidentalis]
MCVACCLKCNETVPCSHCGWPLCKRSCPYLDRHNIECAALKPKQAPVKCFSVTALHVLGVVRIWKTFEQEQGPRLLNLQHEMATPSPEYGTVEAANLKVAREGFRTAVSSAAAMASTMVACSRPETLKGLERASGAAILNGFVLMNEKCGSALYSGLSLLEHSCVPNARVIPDEDSDSDELLLIASRDIAAGEHVTIDYNYQRFPTLSERLRTNASRGFVCRCELCEDPTEKGTYFNAWCCTTCKKEAGYLVEICKRLLDVAVALHPPIHGDWFEVKMFLFEFTMAKLMLQHRHGLQGNRRTVNCEIDKIYWNLF